MKRFLAATLLAATLVASPVQAADVSTMVNANFVFRHDNALCSSTLISAEHRWALTNWHCVDSAIRFADREEVQPDGSVKAVKRVVYDTVTLSQPAYGSAGRVGELTLTAEILAFDKARDLAVLRILSETTPLGPAAKLPPSSFKLAPGNTVWAVGNPVGLENTITRGVISHLFREIEVAGLEAKMRYIQTDAAITGGSSGGSLYSDEGFLIGVPSAGYRGVALNFAIPYFIIQKFLLDNGFGRAWDPSAPSREEHLATQTPKK